MVFTVTNKPPKTQEGKGLDKRLLEIFRTGAGSESAKPFTHQVESFRRLLNNEELYLVAGTASGKTLAVGTPLFYKLEQGKIRKVMLMYPTVALLEDQRRVMDSLAEKTGLSGEVGQLQGGMSRSALLHYLNKRIIVATPDEVYWFFRKNVKYNALLVYGLCQMDEFVLDEAHLFNGLALRNFEHLWQRIKVLAAYIGKTPRLHILTATPTDALRRLSCTEPIYGKSKCYDVKVELRKRDRYDRSIEQFENAINETLESGSRKVLVVCNSARMAHQLFEKCRMSGTSQIPIEHCLRFGKVELGKLNTWLGKTGIEEALIEELNEKYLQEDSEILADLPEGTMIDLSLQDVLAHVTEILERQCWCIKRALWERRQKPGDTWEVILNNKILPCHIIAALRGRLEQAEDLEKQQTIVEEWLTGTIEKLGSIADDPIRSKACEFSELTDVFISIGLDRDLALLLTKRLRFEMRAAPGQLPARAMSRRPIYLRWLGSGLEEEKVEKIRKAVIEGLESGGLEVDYRHIGLWKGTDVPVIIYSGSMAKQARTGLIDVFSDIERAILISTSAVEVGVDFHADVLITEECEGNSFLQRFGRVGRHGKGSKVVAFLSGDVYARLGDLDGARISREEFSERVVDVCPRRNYAARSELLDAHHHLINTQLGRISERLNNVPDLVKVKHIAAKLRQANLQLGFGLRTTLPQISLRDGIAKNPFELLRYVDDQDLYLSDSPFEVARAKVWFTSLVFQRKNFDVIVNLRESLRASQHILLWAGNELHIQSCPQAGITYFARMMNYFERIGEWNKWYPGNFLLLHGDIYLSRIDREIPHPELIRDAEENPLFIPNQTYLVLWGWKDESETYELLKAVDAAEWEELYYDWDRLRQGFNEGAMVILEETTGACFAAYKELVSYVSRQVQS